MKPGRGLALISALLLFISLASCADGADKPPPTPTSVAPSTDETSPTPTPEPSPTVFESDGLRVELVIIERCTPQGGLVKLDSSGFTRDGEYWTSAITPDGDEYPPDLIKNPGNASSAGTTPRWEWPCKGDLPGDYEVTIEDRGAKPYRRITFTITVHES